MLGNDVEAAVVTDIGKVRSENEDAWCYQQPEDPDELLRKGRLVVVCDGMGGHAGGATASRTCVEHVLRVFEADERDEPERTLRQGLEEANAAVHELGQNDPALSESGTTCVALIARGSRAFVAHVGDSRVYLMRGGACHQLTRDHTYVNDLLDMGLISPDEAGSHPEQNMITRCVGMGESLEPDLTCWELQPGDSLLLCSDGLYRYVEEPEMLEIVGDATPERACRQLVDLANDRGGGDNVTVAVLGVREIPEVFAEAHPEDALQGRAPEEAREVVSSGREKADSSAPPVPREEAPEAAPEETAPPSRAAASPAPAPKAHHDVTRVSPREALDAVTRRAKPHSSRLFKGAMLVVAAELVALLAIWLLILRY